MTRRKKQPNKVDQLLDELLEDCQTPEEILGKSGLLQQLSKRLVERALTGELNHHLNQENQAASSITTNRKNGYSSKRVSSDRGELELEIPRDRNNTFEPVLVPKHQRRIAGLDEKIIALYARGLSVRDISEQLEELYGAKISSSLISEVTDSIAEDVKIWQSRPLDELTVSNCLSRCPLREYKSFR